MIVLTAHQPVYLPWLGLFHKISLADKFVFFDAKFRPYDQIVLYTLKTDKLFKIQSITGFRDNMNIKNCYEEQISISAEISKLFPNTTRKTYGPTKKNSSDPSGNSTEKGIYFVFDSGGAAGTSCIDWGEEFLKKNTYSNDHMQVYLDTKQYSDWLRDEAWN